MFKKFSSIIISILLLATSAFAFQPVIRTSTAPKYNNYTATLPAVIAADESAGLKTSADFGGDPYGPNLQPNPDMSGTGGTTSGSGTATGDVADDYIGYADTGREATYGKTSNGYQKFYAVTSACYIYPDASIAMVEGEVWLAEWYLSGVAGTSGTMRITATRGAAITTKAASDGYDSKIFTVPSNQSAAITFLMNGDNGDGATIHWTRLRKLSGANAILTELDRTLRANGTELMPNQVDRDFSGASAWADVDLAAYDETGDLTITADTIGQYCTLPVLSAPTTATKRYQATFDVANLVSTWTLKSFDGTQTIGTISANGPQVFEWTATTTGGYRIVAVADDSSGDFDNFTLDLMQPTLTTIKRVNYVETVLDTSYVEVLGDDLLSGWDFTDAAWVTHGTVSKDDSDSFTSTGNGGISINLSLVSGDSYQIIAAGSTGATNIELRNSYGQGTSGLIGTGFGTYEFTAGIDGTASPGYIYIRNLGTGTTDITQFEIRKVGPRNVTVVKDGTDFNVFYDGTKITEETISDASIVFNKLHSSYGDSVADATIIRYGAGALIATGTCSINKVYLVAVTQADHYGTGVLVGDFFVSDGTETNDANNQVRPVKTE